MRYISEKEYNAEMLRIKHENESKALESSELRKQKDGRKNPEIFQRVNLFSGLWLFLSSASLFGLCMNRIDSVIYLKLMLYSAS